MNKHALAALWCSVFAVTLASRAPDGSNRGSAPSLASDQALVTSYSHTNFDPALRTLVGVGRVQAIEFNGPTGTGNVYLIGCSSSGCDAYPGTVREFSVDTANRRLSATGRSRSLSNNGLSLNHPTGMTFIPSSSTVWMSDVTPGRPARLCKLTWANLFTAGAVFIERCINDDLATPGGGARAEFVRVGGAWFLATADNQDNSGAGQTRLRLYDPRILATATVASQTLYASFLIPPLTQTMAYDVNNDVLVLAQNTSTSPLRGWRLRYLNLSASLSAGTAQYVAPYQDPPYNGDAITDEFEAYHAVAPKLALMTSNTTSLTDALYAFASIAFTTSTPPVTTINLGTAADTRLEQKAPDTNYSGGATLWAAGNSNGGCALAETALRFNLSGLPSGKTITAAKLKLYVTNTSVAGHFQVYSLKRNWSEATATWKQWTAGSPWSAPGANHVPADRGSILRGAFTGTPSTTGYALFPLNSDGIRQVQEWASGLNPNYGFLLRPTLASPCTNAQDDVAFQSREGANPPKLVVTLY